MAQHHKKIYPDVEIAMPTRPRASLGLENGDPSSILMGIRDLTLNFDMTLSARFNVRITTDNPNKKIGIYYEKGSRLSVWYEDSNLCQGTTPKFYQGHQNKTVLNVALTGRNQYGTTLLNALQEQQQTGRVPLDLNINVPVSVKLGALKLGKCDPEWLKVLPPDCLDTFYHEMCKNASDAVDVSDKCCGFFIETLNYGRFMYGLLKQFESMHLCDDKLDPGRAQIIWDKCYGYTKL
ncbi:hypothetical protein SASPL_136487 [Salvia splendens]|uniref:Late embryogenesis abundant protein LEA-2 subgroup domain-containing protein n=1 Tax=Salvia splendens TaxID=180675 RepID=A0A8X8WZW7_SALSN|nr:hypothetical protein SASPL_136487 [Salvia splendens]